MVTTSVEDRVLLFLLQMQQGRGEVCTLGDNFHLQPIDPLTVLSNSSTAFKTHKRLMNFMFFDITYRHESV